MKNYVVQGAYCSCIPIEISRALFVIIFVVVFAAALATESLCTGFGYFRGLFDVFSLVGEVHRISSQSGFKCASTLSQGVAYSFSPFVALVGSCSAFRSKRPKNLLVEPMPIKVRVMFYVVVVTLYRGVFSDGGSVGPSFTTIRTIITHSVQHSRVALALWGCAVYFGYFVWWMIIHGEIARLYKLLKKE